MDRYVIGIDYGSDSCRSVILNAENGKEVGGAVFSYPRWAEGMYCQPEKNIFRQHPLDYLEGLEYVIKEALKEVPREIIENIKGISVDTTGSTPAPVDENGTLLALLPEFKDNPNAMFVLWKDHSSIKEAEEINYTAKNISPIDYTKYIGGVYSSEWFWAKILHVLREDEEVRSKAYTWLEHCDWIPAVLTGKTNPKEIIRGRCAAGHKAMWNEEFGGLPSNDFFKSIDPLLDGLRDRMSQKTYTSEKAVGTITSEWAEKLGLPKDVVIGVGAFDAHMGAVGAGIRPYSFVKIMGTSTCDILLAPKEDIGDKLVPGICGQVDGSVCEGMIGMEAGQSAFGDVYAWFRNILMWPLGLLEEGDELKERYMDKILPALEEHAMKVQTKENGILAIDWLNGRRTPYANQNLKGAIVGLNLASEAPYIYRSLVESTAYGAKKIVNKFLEEGVEVREIIATGGVAKKSPFIMQTMANVINRPIKVAKSLQTVARGAAMFAAIASGIYQNVNEAQEHMGEEFEREYHPQPEMIETYTKIYENYNNVGAFLEREVHNV